MLYLTLLVVLLQLDIGGLLSLQLDVGRVITELCVVRHRNGL